MKPGFKIRKSHVNIYILAIFLLFANIKNFKKISHNMVFALTGFKLTNC